uniref:Uncharacterized protein n=1 Tax=Picea glauca TaxID=3330 RepID=A0A117NIG9_PICGL|nr:hypothetical protein ABT39_MTgene3168 [Picea glauca]
MMTLNKYFTHVKLGLFTTRTFPDAGVETMAAQWSSGFVPHPLRALYLLRSGERLVS